MWYCTMIATVLEMYVENLEIVQALNILSKKMLSRIYHFGPSGRSQQEMPYAGCNQPHISLSWS